MMSEYRAKHWDYDFNDTDNCPTAESVRESMNSPQPIDLDLVDYYFFSLSKNKFIDSNNALVTGLAILENYSLLIVILFIR